MRLSTRHALRSALAVMLSCALAWPVHAQPVEPDAREAAEPAAPSEPPSPNAYPSHDDSVVGQSLDDLGEGGSSGTIGGMSEAPPDYQYTSPLKRIGLNLGLGTYVVGACVSLIYMIYVYPLVRLFGGHYFQTVMPWLLVPIAGPWMAQYEGSVKDKPAWRGVLIADAGLQAVGLVLGVLGVLLSGKRTGVAPESEPSIELTLGATGARLTVRL